MAQARARADYLISLDRRPAERQLRNLVTEAKVGPDRVQRLALIAVDATLAARYADFDAAINALRDNGRPLGADIQQLIALLVQVNQIQRSGDYALGQQRLRAWLERPGLGPDLGAIAQGASAYFYQLTGESERSQYAYYVLQRDYAGKVRSPAATYYLATSTSTAELFWGSPKSALDGMETLASITRDMNLPFTGVDELHNIVWLLRKFDESDAAYDISSEMERKMGPGEADFDVAKSSLLCGRANMLKRLGKQALACFRQGEALLDRGSNYEFRWLAYAGEAAVLAGDLVSAEAYLRRLEAHPRRAETEANRLAILELDAKLKQKKGDYPAAARAFEAYSKAALAEQARELEKTRTIHFELLKQETDRLSERASLMEGRARLQAQMAHRSYVILALAILAVALLVGFVVYLVRSRAAIARTREAALAANEAKSRFLAQISHELRTPLTGILGMAGLLEGTVLTDRQKEMVTSIRGSGDDLLAVINDILDVTRLEVDKLKIRPERFSPSQVIETCLTSFQPAALEAGVVLEGEVQDSVSEVYLGDAGRIRQILSNLIGNAMKFTGEGSIAVTCAADRSQGGDFAFLDFVVADTGVGMTQSTAERVLGTFEQADQSLRRGGGAGLGLNIARQLAELMGGGLRIESEPGKGTNVYVRIRVDVVEPSEVEASAPSVDGDEEELGGGVCRVLVGEDHPVNQKILNAILNAAGHTVVTGSNGKEVVEAFANEAFDVVLMDIQMPVMDGIEALHRIRQIEAEEHRAYTPVLAVTAHVMPNERDIYLQEGFDGLLAKPIDAGELLKRVSASSAP